MGLFFKETHYREEMSDYLRELMISYMKDRLGDADEIVAIFSDANELIKHSAEREVRKGIKQYGLNVESSALNILQNVAMQAITPVSGADFILGKTGVAYKLYNDVNSMKFNKGYIDKKQFDDNAALGDKLGLQSPLGSMFE